MTFQLSDVDFSYTSEYVSHKEFENFYRSVIESGVAYRDFLNTMGVITSGIEITLAVVSDNVTVGGEVTHMWKVMFERAENGINATVLGTYSYEMLLLIDRENDEVVYSVEEVEYDPELLESFLVSRGFEGVDVSGIWN